MFIWHVWEPAGISQNGFKIQAYLASSLPLKIPYKLIILLAEYLKQIEPFLNMQSNQTLVDLITSDSSSQNFSAGSLHSFIYAPSGIRI